MGLSPLPRPPPTQGLDFHKTSGRAWNIGSNTNKADTLGVGQWGPSVTFLSLGG